VQGLLSYSRTRICRVSSVLKRSMGERILKKVSSLVDLLSRHLLDTQHLLLLCYSHKCSNLITESGFVSTENAVLDTFSTPALEEPTCGLLHQHEESGFGCLSMAMGDQRPGKWGVLLRCHPPFLQI
jgi:hypothetical protein